MESKFYKSTIRIRISRSIPLTPETHEGMGLGSWGRVYLKRSVFSLCLKDGREIAVQMSSGSSFHNVGASFAK